MCPPELTAVLKLADEVVALSHYVHSFFTESLGSDFITCFVTGLDFSRAEKLLPNRGFSP
jgi:hypothetical protein